MPRLNLVAGRLTMPNIVSRCNQLKLVLPNPLGCYSHYARWLGDHVQMPVNSDEMGLPVLRAS